MAVAAESLLINFYDARLPPRIGSGDCENNDGGYPSVQMVHDGDMKSVPMNSTDDDDALFIPLAPAKLNRSGSLGNSWGVSAVGRGFGAKWGKKHKDDDVHEVRADGDVFATDGDQSRPQVNGTSVTTSDAPTSPTTQQALQPLTIGPDATQDSPLTPSPSDYPSPPLPNVQLSSPPRDLNISRPVLPARAQSLYHIPPPKPTALLISQPADDTQADSQAQKELEEQVRLGRQRAWSRPLNSPLRSSTGNFLAPTKSAPHLASRHTFAPMSVIVDPNSIPISTPTTPRSPRLTRSR